MRLNVVRLQNLPGTCGVNLADPAAHGLSVVSVDDCPAGRTRHARCAWSVRVGCVSDVSPAPAGIRRAAPGGARALRDVPCTGRGARRRTRPAAVRRAGVPGLPDLRRALRRVRPVPVRGVRIRPVRGLLLQGPPAVRELRRPAYDGAGGAPGRPGLSGGARPAVGADAAATRALPRRLGSRALPRRGAGVRAGRARLAPAPGAPAGRGGRPRRRRGHRPAVRLGAQPQRPRARARARRGVRTRLERAAALLADRNSRTGRDNGACRHSRPAGGAAAGPAWSG